MQVLVLLTAGLAFWISAWAFGWGSFDAFLVTIGLLVVGAALYVFRPYVKRFLGQR